MPLSSKLIWIIQRCFREQKYQPVFYLSSFSWTELLIKNLHYSSWFLMYFFNRVIKPSKKLCPSSEKSVNISISEMPCHLLVLLTACLSSALIVPLVASLNILCHTECNTDACANVPLSGNSKRVHRQCLHVTVPLK